MVIIIFFIFLWFGKVSWTTNMRLYGHWKNVCYTFYAQWFNLFFFHLTIGSSLTLIQNELWVPNCCHAHLEVFFLCLGFSKDVIKILAYYMPIIFFIHHFFGWKVVKNGSLVVCFHFNRLVKYVRYVGSLGLGLPN